jgi:trk system potassium uptake protein TrkH
MKKIRYIRKHHLIELNPPRFLLISFVLLFTLGAVLLKLPIATTKYISWPDAFFMATSAATVTGLGTVDLSATFTLFGQTVMLLLIEVGGLGIMTFGILVFIMLGRRIGIKQRLIMQEALNQPSVGGVIKLVRQILTFTIIIELIAISLLALRWVPIYGWSRGLFYSLFHTIAAFNNAGFALWPDNLTRFALDPVVNLVISTLIILGGLGFTVIIDLYHKKEAHKLSLHTKVMLLGTLIMNIVGFIFIFALEYHNPKTIGELPMFGKVMAAYFQSVTTRTAGFNTIDISALEPSTAFFMIFYMFVGAGSTSTGGGIKLTTFVVIIAVVITFIRGNQDINIFKKRIRGEIIYRALTITTISTLFVFTAAFILMITEKGSFLQILFETVSAFGTVGLTMNFTPYLTTAGKIILIVVMVFGKIGPLTLMYSITNKQKEKIRYPEGNIFTG